MKQNQMVKFSDIHLEFGWVTLASILMFIVYIGKPL